MKLSTLHTLLVLTASVTAASSATATTWNATTDFNATNNTGVWTYGTCAVTSAPVLDVNNYVFNLDTYNAATFGGGDWVGNGASWAKSGTGNTEWGNNGEPLAWISLLSDGGNKWIFGGPGLYVQPYAIGNGSVGDATIIRWTAPEAGTFNVTSSLLDLNIGGLVDQVIQTTAGGTRTVIHSIAGSPLAVNTTDSFAGSVTLAAGDTLDLVTYQDPSSRRTYGVVTFEISSVPEPTSLGLMTLGAVALLRRGRRS